MKPTIAQFLKIKKFPFEIKDENGNEIYHENSKGFWIKREFNSNGNKIYFENSDGYWVKYKFNSNGNRIYFENSKGYWVKREFDSNGKFIYYEDCNGKIIDNRNKEVVLTLDEIAIKFNIPVEQLKIKK
jgi:hypothetical protein